MNNRFSKTVGSSKIYYVFTLEGQLIGELDAGMNLVKTFVYASKSHVPDYFIDQDGNSFKIITDHLGSVRLIVDVTTGEVVQKMHHDEFGKVLIDTNSNATPFGFAGGLYDVETGLVRFGARDYDPQVGRWTSKDPIRFEGGDSNLYGYVIQDPVNLIDPEGLSSMYPGMGQVGGAEYCRAISDLDRSNLTALIRSYDSQLSDLNGQISNLEKGNSCSTGNKTNKNLLKLKLERARITTLKRIATGTLGATKFSGSLCNTIGPIFDFTGISPVSY